MKSSLRPHQIEALSQLKRSILAGNKRPLVQAPTGAGKTVIAAAITEGAMLKGNRVVFVVPALSLIDQTVQAFWREGITDVGVIQADHALTDWSKPIQVASVQTLQRRRLPDADVVVIDEAHRWFKFYGDWMKRPNWRDAPFIGLSATPWTRGLGKHYDDLIVAATTADLIEDGYLAPFRVFAPSHPDLTGVRTVAGDYHEGQLSEAMNKDALVADVVDTWLKLGEDRPTLVFGVDRAHAKHLQQLFERRGVPCGYQDAFTDNAERAQIRDAFQAGRIKVVCNVGTLTTGVDWDVRCIVLARPTKSEMLFTQIIGRGLRTAPGKEDCIARDSLVLTDKGEVKIQDITLEHKVWDGVSFVSHKGAVRRGIQRVIRHDGVTGTPDHKVMTNVGWESLESAARHGRRIARTGVGGAPVRLTEDCFADGRGEFSQPPRRGRVRSMRGAAHGALPQHQEASGNEGLPDVQWAGAGDGAQVALPPVPSAAGSLLQSALNVLRALWRARRRVSISERQCGRALDSREHRGCGSINGNRPDQQRWALRTRQSSLGSSGQEYGEQHKVSRLSRSLHLLSEILSACALRRRHADEVNRYRNERRRDCGPVGGPVVQAEGEVWDILNAGPLQRFTANGRLVHNCIILDHSDTTLRLGFVTDIHHDKLDDGAERQPKKPQERVRLPKECPKCAYLKPPKVGTCPSCGFKPEKQSNVEHEDGELVELTPKAQKADKATKQLWYSAFLRIAHERGYKPGWAANQYRGKFGVWPRGLREISTDPPDEVRSYVKAQLIRFAKRKEKEQSGGGNVRAA